MNGDGKTCWKAKFTTSIIIESERERGECVHSEQGLIVHLGGRSFEEDGRKHGEGGKRKGGDDDACSSSADLCGARRGEGMHRGPYLSGTNCNRQTASAQGGFTISYSELQVERRLFERGVSSFFPSSTWLLVFTQRRQQTSPGVNSISRGREKGGGEAHLRH